MQHESLSAYPSVHHPPALQHWPRHHPFPTGRGMGANAPASTSLLYPLPPASVLPRPTALYRSWTSPEHGKGPPAPQPPHPAAQCWDAGDGPHRHRDMSLGTAPKCAGRGELVSPDPPGCGLAALHRLGLVVSITKYVKSVSQHNLSGWGLVCGFVTIVQKPGWGNG